MLVRVIILFFGRIFIVLVALWRIQGIIECDEYLAVFTLITTVKTYPGVSPTFMMQVSEVRMR